MKRTGWAAPLEGLADKVEALIKAGKVPAAINLAAVEAAASRYVAFTPTDKTLPPSKAARQVEILMKKADTMGAELARLPFEVSDALALAGARPGGAHVRAAVTDASAALRHLAGALELARREIEAAPKREGRPPSPRAMLVLDLATIVEAAGGVADARQAGPVVKLTEVVLKAHGESFTEAMQIVETALDYRQS